MYTLGRPPRDEGSARRRSLFLHYTQISIPLWDSNRQSQQASRRRSARPPVSAITTLSGMNTNIKMKVISVPLQELACFNTGDKQANLFPATDTPAKYAPSPD